MELTEFFEFEDNIYIKTKKIMYNDIELTIETNTSQYELFNQLISKVKKLDCVYDKNNYYYRMITKLLHNPFLLKYEKISGKIIEVFQELQKYITEAIKKKNTLLSLAITELNNIDLISHFPDLTNDYVLPLVLSRKDQLKINIEDYKQQIRFKNEFNILYIQYNLIFQILIKYLDFAQVKKNDIIIKQFEHLPYIKEKVELIDACRNDDIKKAKRILDKDLNIRFNTYDGKTIFDIPINNENENFIKFLVSYPEIDLYVYDVNKQIPIKNANELINKSVFNILLDRMADSYTYKLGMKTTLLIWAICNNEKDIYNYILNNTKPKNINLSDSNDRTALIWAIKKKNRQIIDILLKYPGIDVNVYDKYGNSPLLLTAIHNDIATMKRLITDFKVNVNAKNCFGNTSLIIATDKKLVEITNLLIDNNDTDVNISNNNKITALMYAIFKDCYDIVYKLLKHPKLDINAVDNKGNSVLMLASKKGNIQLVKAILDFPNVNINLLNSENKTALVYSIEKNMIKVTELLLQQNNIIVNTIDINGDTPLTSFIKVNPEENMVHLKTLLKTKKFNVNIVDKNLRSPLILACDKNYPLAVKYLLKVKDIDFNLQDKYKNTALIFAAINGNAEIIKMLISRNNTNVNTCNNIGKTALMLTIKDTKCVQLMLKRKDLNLNMKERKGRTALYIAIEKGYLDSAKILLLNKNTNPFIKDLRGVSPKDLAMKNNYNDLIKIISKCSNTRKPNLKTISEKSSMSNSLNKAKNYGFNRSRIFNSLFGNSKSKESFVDSNKGESIIIENTSEIIDKTEEIT
ncbi:ankyrin repeat-containing domain protein [Neocallimastix lanati (nom. inval.)]|nr:ankyrin repeat-containing domain protein [Neocallimastix sp. JGI-2020a]